MDLSPDALAPRLAARFAFGGPPTAVEPLGGGHINDSFRVAAPGGTFLLQRLNPSVFPHGIAVMENVANVTRHLAARIPSRGSPWRMPVLVPTVDGAAWATDEWGALWRAFPFLEGVTTTGRAETPAQARETARAFGAFIGLLADYDGPPLHETIRGFHDTALRFAQLEEAARRDPRRRLAGSRLELDALLAERQVAEVLPPLVAAGTLPRRPVHNDAKISNVLFDAATDAAVSVIDLDTVMPGLVLHDVGDMLRSMAAAGEEDDRELPRMEARPAFVAAVAEGFLETAGAALAPAERERLVFAGRLITLEQAVRFLADHLAGDRYYRVHRAGHNLERARAQLALYRSLTRQEEALAALISGG